MRGKSTQPEAPSWGSCRDELLLEAAACGPVDAAPRSAAAAAAAAAAGDAAAAAAGSAAAVSADVNGAEAAAAAAGPSLGQCERQRCC